MKSTEMTQEVTSTIEDGLKKAFRAQISLQRSENSSCTFLTADEILELENAWVDLKVWKANRVG
ncbi:hypothetical protein MHO82_09335 [Vibrio sp. Of7-15]|uniref:hypothetical protein n=1 Tax=Vibrio sp. Of7-15 TaxID=2724879 RepID=UPI001EF17E2F|nr:hypothetical protein [Vibrio sp. Of7-15]MCG7497068.1 hypothetical protein [Vibrio sp. Of7-15]